MNDEPAGAAPPTDALISFGATDELAFNLPASDGFERQVAAVASGAAA